jgi:hypothetical protein
MKCDRNLRTRFRVPSAEYRQKVEGATTNLDVRAIDPVLIAEWNTGRYDLRKMLRVYAGLSNYVSHAHAKVLETFGMFVGRQRQKELNRKTWTSY